MTNKTLVRVKAGDVVEFDANGETVSGLVLLASVEAVIVDLCDGSMPLVARPEEMCGVRVFRAADAG
jgi:hypothetical protein